MFRLLRSEAIRLVSRPEHSHEPQSKAVSPLRQRMIEDMRMRKLSPKTQPAYIRSVRQFARYLRRSPDTAIIEDLRNYQLHLVDSGTSPISLNATITGLKFFFGVTLDRGAMMAKMQHVFVPRTLPIVVNAAPAPGPGDAPATGTL